jgi:pentatricopeptide repeat protein
MNDRQKKAAFLLMLIGFVDAVKAGGSLGAPAGVLYSAVLGQMTLDQFNTVMGALVKNGNVRKSGDLYHYVKDIS